MRTFATDLGTAKNCITLPRQQKKEPLFPEHHQIVRRMSVQTEAEELGGDTERPEKKWASSRQNLSSGFPTKRVSNQPLQLQRLARKLEFHL